MTLGASVSYMTMRIEMASLFSDNSKQTSNTRVYW